MVRPTTTETHSLGSPPVTTTTTEGVEEEVPHPGPQGLLPSHPTPREHVPIPVPATPGQPTPGAPGTQDPHGVLRVGPRELPPLIPGTLYDGVGDGEARDGHHPDPSHVEVSPVVPHLLPHLIFSPVVRVVTTIQGVLPLLLHPIPFLKVTREVLLPHPVVPGPDGGNTSPSFLGVSHLLTHVELSSMVVLGILPVHPVYYRGDRERPSHRVQGSPYPLLLRVYNSTLTTLLSTAVRGL